MERYRPSGDYGLIGDCRTAALVAPDGSIDWFCWPRFDSPAVFVRLLDADRGGAWRVAPTLAGGDGAMRYRPQTAVLETTHGTADGAVRIVDATPSPEFPAHGHTRIMRLVEGLAGSVEMTSVLDAQPGFGDAALRTLASDTVTELSGEGFFARLGIAGGEPAAVQDGSAVIHRFTVGAGERVALMLVCGEGVHGVDDVEDLRIMYAVDGSAEIPERILERFEDYRGSRPVRIGNAAVGRLQLDVYGEVLDCLRVCDAYGLDIVDDVWPDFRRVADWVAGNWRRPDNGIWEVRGGRRHFVFSKVMAWVALDRGAALAERAGENDDAARWRAQADELHDEVLDRGWSDRRGAFRQSYEE